MLNHHLKYIGSLLILCLMISPTYAQEDSAFGQVIQIDTRFHSFVGKPIWTLEIHDVDNNETVPYSFEITRTNNHWVVFTYGRNYLITGSTVQIPAYGSYTNKYKNYRIRNFCHLESNGRIMKGVSMRITVEGNLSPNTDTYTCHISSYRDDNYYIYRSPSN
jgi:hypothetical protein